MTEQAPYQTVLQNLLFQQRVAALGTVDEHGDPQVSMVPFALDRETGNLVIHVSTLSTHTANLRKQASAGLMVMQPEQAGTGVHALPRVSLQVEASFVDRDTALCGQTKEIYTTRFPDMAFMTDFADFSLVRLVPRSVRLISGFGAARKIELSQWMGAVAPD